jgi:hypothetical protein
LRFLNDPTFFVFLLLSLLSRGQLTWVFNSGELTNAQF